MANKIHDIVDTAAAGSFKTLVTAAKAAGLVDMLKGPGPFTLFAPNDDASAKLPVGTMDNLVRPENKVKLAIFSSFTSCRARCCRTERWMASGLSPTMGVPAWGF